MVSNPGPLALESDALPTELHGPLKKVSNGKSWSLSIIDNVLMGRSGGAMVLGKVSVLGKFQYQFD